MAVTQETTFNQLFSKANFSIQNTAFAVSLLCILAVFVVPLPKSLLDFALCLSLTFSLVILITVLIIEKPLHLSVFPTILLVGTMLRLALNVAATRLILTDGHHGPDSAGGLIHTFGDFVMGGNFVIGIIVFAILVVINFIVITKGSGRIAEVAARFSLDALPGKQMAVDADLGAGAIDEKEARERRKYIQEEMSFYGAMDGAAKFVRGDAIAAILIVLINIIGGMIIGMAQNGMNFLQASKTYTFLTVGEGLVSQIPALILSVAAGMLVSKSASEGSSDKQIVSQLSAYPAALGISAFFMLFLAFIPGIPKIPFFAIASILAFSMRKAIVVQSEDQNLVGDRTEEKAVKKEDDLGRNLAIDPIRIELSYSLLELAANDGPLVSMVKIVRNKLTEKLGFIIPSIRIVDNSNFVSDKYAVFIKNLKLAEGNVYKHEFLAIPGPANLSDIKGRDVLEPVNKTPAKWVKNEDKEKAREKGAAIINPVTVIATHLTFLIEENITELFSATVFNNLLQTLDKSISKIYQDLVPSQLQQSVILRVCSNLLQEGVSIRDLGKIIESIAEVSYLKSAVLITEHVRLNLSRYICSKFAEEQGQDGVLSVVSIAPEWEQAFEKALIGDDENKIITLAPDVIDKFMLAINDAIKKCNAQFHIVCAPVLRVHVKKMIQRNFSTIQVLSYAELQSKVPVKILGDISKE